jgi:two component transcriptional regulator, lytTR family
MPITCIIVDDEPMALQLLESYVLRTPYLQLEGKFSNGIEVLQFLHEKKQIDIIFMDIQMPEIDGLELSKKIPIQTKIIFTTAFDQYAIEGYKVNATGYLLKPFNYIEFLEATEKAKQLLLPTKNKEVEIPDYIFVKSEYKQIKIFLNDIIYIESMKDYAKIFLTSQSSPIVTLLSLKKLNEELPKEKFMRVHRSFIVSLEKIEIVEKNQIVFGKQRITVAEPYREQFENFINARSI